MFRKNLKLLATMVGLVAVLVGLMAMPGVTQGSFSRQALVSTLKTEISALLTAGTDEPLDLESAILFSSSRSTAAYIPPRLLSTQLLKDFALQGAGIFLGAVYVGEDMPNGGLRKGLYYIKVISREQAILISQTTGEIVATRWIKWTGEPTTFAYYLDKGAHPTIEFFTLARITPGESEGGGTTQPPVSPPPPPPPPPDLCFEVGVKACLIESPLIDFGCIGAYIHF